MRIGIAALFGVCLVCAAPAAWGQVPGPVPPGTPGAVAPIAPPPSAPPGSPAAPPMAWPPPGAVQPPGYPPPVPAAPPVPMPQALPSPLQALPPAPARPESPPILFAHRVGFGGGLSFAPLRSTFGMVQGSLSSPVVSMSDLVSGSLGIRAWTSERLVLVPSLHLGIGRTWFPRGTNSAGSMVDAGGFTTGVVAPELSLGFAVYRGKSTRFVLSGGAGVTYEARAVQTSTSQPNGDVPTYEVAKYLWFEVPVGFSFEQALSPKISVVFGLEAPIFAYGSYRLGADLPMRFVGAALGGTQLSGAIFFYTD